ncbi:hypothetical protein [Colwellia sp. Bg11-28]|uniref:hypothetical protein n=1 Tax=Colwellia sp. Bg11-28 TaxID=2058305 RepID=UPI000C32E7DE|nr:hypothetical protein [Colwellia sp. Bg11-28]PKH86240.1 hypothetical protein CXF79_16095 [Colwellia sp. Bg11-28]PKH89018.1 hypothetical protein CXF79_03805 [Colwellia sp. Bg11-28]
MNKLVSFLKTKKVKTVAAVSAIAGSSAAVQAADYTAQIGTAVTEGSGNVTAVIAGVIGVAILGFGVGKMLGWFGR